MCVGWWVGGGGVGEGVTFIVYTCELARTHTHTYTGTHTNRHTGTHTVAYQKNPNQD